MPPLKKKKNGRNAKVKKNDQVFTLFPKLPAEIQSLIWRHCLPARRVLYLQVPPWSSVEAENYRSALRSYRYLPSVAGVCREAHRVALDEFNQRQQYVIDDERNTGYGAAGTEPEYHALCGVHRQVTFNPVTDVIYVNDITSLSGCPTDPGKKGHDPEAPHLVSLLAEPSVALCIPTNVALRRTDFLHRLAGYGHRSFYLALGGEFTWNLPRERCVERDIFGIGGDDNTVLINLADGDGIAKYRQAYNGNHLKSTIEYRVAAAVRGWVNTMEELRLDKLAAEALPKVEEAWAKMMKERADKGQEPTLAEMPVPIPVLFFRRITKYRRS